MAGTEGFDAAEVARKEFATGFRGFDQYEVRAYLAKLAAEMGVLQERERGLRERLHELERKRPSEKVLADEEFEAALGTEATKVIHAARQAASEIRAHAEENVARLLREAQDESQAMRSEAAGLLSARTEEAEAVAAQIVEAAQRKGREMVAEAQAVRERMLRDLSRRRRHAEAQVQLLLGGRDRLVEALEQVAQAAGETTARLGAVELSDLPPIEAAPETAPEAATTPNAGPAAPVVGPPPPGPEPVPDAVAGPDESIVVIDDDRPGEAPPASPRPVDDRRPGSLRLLRRRSEPAAVSLEDDVEGVRIIRPAPPAVEPDAEVAATTAETAAAATDVAGTEAAGTDAAETDAAETEGAGTEAAGTEAAGTDDAGAAPSVDVAVGEPADGDDVVAGAGAADTDARPVTPVVELFARLRADRASAPAEPEPASEPAVADADADIDADADAAEAATDGRSPVADEPGVGTDAGPAHAPGAGGAAVDADLQREATGAEVAGADIAGAGDGPETTSPEATSPEATSPETSASETPSSEMGEDPEPEVEVEVDAAFEARDAALEEAERALARSLKRALADEQNEVLDALRRLKGTPRLEVLLPDPEVHRARYQRVAAGPVGTAAEAGAAAARAAGASAGRAAVDELAGRFADEVSDDLRARLQRALDAGTADAEVLVETISAGYREWKSSR
ncbi:MAG: DivIVA domain-containing protein, partial [Acidimicrobiia bacterium]